MLPRQLFFIQLQAQVLADGDEFHLGSDDAVSGIVHLRYIATGPGSARRADVRKAQAVQAGVGGPAAAVLGARLHEDLGVVALLDPGLADLGQTLANIDGRLRVGIGPGGVVDRDRRVLFSAEIGRGVGQGDLAHGHADIGPAALDMDFARIRIRLDGGIIHPRGLAQEFLWVSTHAALLAC